MSEFDTNSNDMSGDNLSNTELVNGNQSDLDAVRDGDPMPDQYTQPDVQQQQMQQQLPSWNGQEYALKFRGRDIVPESKDKLLNWAQLGYSYDKRAADLKAREEQIAQQQQAHEQYERLAQAFEANPAFKQQILNLYYQSLNGQQQGQQQQQLSQDGQQGQQAQQTPDMAQFAPYLSKIEQIEQQVQAWQSKQADDSLNSEVNSLKEKYPDVDWETPDENGVTLLQDVMQDAFKHGGLPLEYAFRNKHWDTAMENAKANALKAQQEQIIAQKKKGIVAGAPRPAQPVQKQPVNPRDLSYDAIARQALSAVG